MEKSIMKFFDFSAIANNADFQKVLDSVSGAMLITMWTKLVPLFLGLALIKMVYNHFVENKTAGIDLKELGRIALVLFFLAAYGECMWLVSKVVDGVAVSMKFETNESLVKMKKYEIVMGVRKQYDLNDKQANTLYKRLNGKKSDIHVVEVFTAEIEAERTPKEGKSFLQIIPGDIMEKVAQGISKIWTVYI